MAKVMKVRIYKQNEAIIQDIAIHPLKIPHVPEIE